MRMFTLFLAFALSLAIPVHAGGDRPQPQSTSRPGVELRAPAPVPDLAVTRREQIVTPLIHLPQLPEPEVFAMMLVGLVLIGYRVSRDGGDKFR